MSELDKYIKLKASSKTSTVNLEPLDVGQFNGKAIYKADDERVGYVINTKATKSAKMGIDTYMVNAGADQAVCFYKTGPNYPDSYLVRFFSRKGFVSAAYNFHSSDIMYAGDEYQSVG